MQSRLVRRLVRFQPSSMTLVERLCRRARTSSSTWRRPHCLVLPSKAPHKCALPCNQSSSTPHSFLALAYPTLPALRQKLTWNGTCLSRAQPILPSSTSIACRALYHDDMSDISLHPAACYHMHSAVGMNQKPKRGCNAALKTEQIHSPSATVSNASVNAERNVNHPRFLTVPLGGEALSDASGAAGEMTPVGWKEAPSGAWEEHLLYYRSVYDLFVEHASRASDSIWGRGEGPFSDLQVRRPWTRMTKE